MEQSGLDFWQKHSIRFLEMVFRTDKRESLQNPDGCGKASRVCGDTVEIFLSVRDGKILQASFDTDGCIYSVACANALVHLVEGKSLDEAWELEPEDIVHYLETLPAEEFHCAELAVRVLHLALANVQETARNPWKRLYPRP